SVIGSLPLPNAPQIHAAASRMIGEAALLLAEIGAAQLALLAGVAFVAATVSGMSGVGGGLLLAIFIAPVVGVKAVVPTVGIATLIAHVVRVWVYREHIVWRPALAMLLGAVPATIASARLYVALPADVIAIILSIFLLSSVPLRRLMARRELRFGPRFLGLIGATYGFLAGTTIGGGVLVIPALLGAGLAGIALLATDAVIGLSSLTVKALVFGGFDVLTPRLLLIGCLLGGCMIPGTYLARWLVRRTPLHVHVVAMEVIVVLGACSFLWRAFAG
ncbi:MAG TPA: TSUP family transporter, partial [Geminicoccaceae bacterium]|nr:TSUP family transporter [Geminicoccaceae bacterium]